MACTFREDLNFLANDSFRFINNATITVIVIATFNGIEVKSPVIIPTPKNNATNNNKGIMPKHCSFMYFHPFTCFPIKNTSFSQTMKKEVFMSLPAYLQTITVTGIGTFEMLPRLHRASPSTSLDK